MPSCARSDSVHLRAVEGQAEVETINKTSGKPYNGTLKYQLTDPRTAKEFAPLWDSSTNNWTVVPDVKVWFNEAGKQNGILPERET